MKNTNHFLIIKDESDLSQLKEHSLTCFNQSEPYAYYKGAFIRTYNLNTFPSFYKKSSDGHTWDKISSDFFKTLVIEELSDLTNKKRQLVELLGELQSPDGSSVSEKITDEYMTDDSSENHLKND